MPVGVAKGCKSWKQGSGSQQALHLFWHRKSSMVTAECSSFGSLMVVMRMFLAMLRVGKSVMSEMPREKRFW